LMSKIIKIGQLFLNL